MKDLEEDLGVMLFERGNRKITLTEEGQVLRRRAEELVRLMQLTQEEIAQVKHRLTGSIRIGAGESQAFRYFAETAATLLKEHPDVQLHITSGDTQDLMDELDNGLIDFALIFTEFDREKYRSIQLPAADCFGVLMRRDAPLASKAEIRMEDLAEVSLMISRASQSYWKSVAETRNLNIIGTSQITGWKHHLHGVLAPPSR
jgi:DNA-binding transcriptional LysR family regulator